jgi:hypothetical protein
MSLLPTHRDVSPSSSRNDPTAPPLHSSTRSETTQVDNETAGSNGAAQSEKINADATTTSSEDEKKYLSSDAYEQRGELDLDDEGELRRVRVVLEKKSGKEIIQDVGVGRYTTPRL